MLLIAMQMPEATLVAGYKAWQKNFGRHVNKGERAIRILAPSPYTIKEERDEFVSREKATLSLEIAKREREILGRIHYQGGYSLCIGIPFCPTTCLYCSFTSFPIAGYRDLVDRYQDCLIREMELTAAVMKGQILDSVYIGGGMPTTLEPGQLDRLLSKLESLFDLSTVQEFTVEAGRADSITEEKLKILSAYGISRIFVNPQTMKQETLDIIGRRASVAQVEQAYALARKVGFDNINMDLILGLPGELEADVQNQKARRYGILGTI